MKGWVSWLIALLPAVAGLLGCATTPPSSFYALIPIEAASVRSAPLDERWPRIALGPLSIPDFLDRPQLVSRDGVALHIDELHRWGGSLAEEFLRVWGENLAHLLETSQVFVYPSEANAPVDFRILADLLRFEAGADGATHLKVRWVVVDPGHGDARIVRESTYRRPLPSAPGVASDERGQVAGLSAVLGDFSRDVAAALRRLTMAQE